MDDEQFLNATMLHAGYIAVCVGLLVLVHSVRWFDLRSLRRMAREGSRALVSTETETEEEGGPPPRDRTDMLERPDLGAILNLLVIVGTAFAAFIGWQFPEQIEFFYGSGGSMGLWAPQVEMTVLGRAAQVVGAVCLGLVALRLLKLLVWFTAAGAVGAGAAAAASYVFELDLFGLF